VKYIIASFLILFSSLSFAVSDDDVYVTDNQDGGKIYLFNVVCPVTGLESTHISMATSGSSITFGCWLNNADQIFVVWFPDNSDPLTVIYENEFFVLEKLI
jgi:hypothetical protein